jgi:DNA-binding GntR family transcriptional regulator
VPEALRQIPLHLQIAGALKDQILTRKEGFRSGDKIPSIRALAREWKVGYNAAERAVAYLKTEGLVRTDGSGTYVNGPRGTLGPQQRLRLAARPEGEAQDVLAAGLVPCPGYVLPILGLTKNSQVIRREWVTREEGSPDAVQLTVTWCPPSLAGAVPELLDASLPFDMGAAAATFWTRTGHDVSDLAGWSAFEARAVKDDGREAPLLGLELSGFVLAGVYTWATPGAEGDVTEYGEYVVRPGRVIESSLEP